MKITKVIKSSMENVKTRQTAMIAFLGDSVTQGCFELYNAKDGGYQTEFKNREGYHNKLKDLFDIMFPQASVGVINAGISGDNAPNGARRVKNDVIAYNPQLAVVCFGLNDANGGMEAIEDYAEGLRGIFRQLKEADIDVIFMTPNMMATYPTCELMLENFDSVADAVVNTQTSGTMDAYMQRAREVCKEEEIPVCDCYERWKKLDEAGADITRLLSNRVNHPIEKMHWLFAWSLFEMIMDF